MTTQRIFRSARVKIPSANQVNFLPCIHAEIIPINLVFHILPAAYFVIYCLSNQAPHPRCRPTTSAGKWDPLLQHQFWHLWPKCSPIIKHLLSTWVLPHTDTDILTLQGHLTFKHRFYKTDSKWMDFFLVSVCFHVNRSVILSTPYALTFKVDNFQSEMKSQISQKAAVKWSLQNAKYRKC